MPQIDVLVIAAAALSTLVIWLGVVVQGRIAAALASRR
ncbi:sodium:solute symporter [Rhodopseudomonas palustris]|nr:sodium:solute symporter [Rhodopseudomonas palustris]WQH01349.1 sodium:solute symporter [Rhodopseudomonas palustris]